MNTLRIWAGVLTLLPVLCTTSYADENLEFDCPEPPDEVIIDNPSEVWLDGTVCFEGGHKTNVRHAHAFANAHGLEFSETYRDYWDRVKAGELVLMSNEHVMVETQASRPHVLPSTASFVQGIGQGYFEAECGKLAVTSGGRLTSELQDDPGSEFSVHPAGMAVDLKIKDVSIRCVNTLARLLYQAEAQLAADTTRERVHPHFHVVVIPPKLLQEESVLVADARSASTSGGQGE